MTAIQINQLTLDEVIGQFQLVETTDLDFFSEWQGELPEIDDRTQEDLDRIKANYAYLSRKSLDEGVVKLVVLGRLLSLAGFYEPPFRLITEKAVQISAVDEDQIFRGMVDILAMHEKVWVLLVEAKHNRFSLEPALPQALAYMSAAPYPDYPTFGLITNGQNFLFLKMLNQVYGTSKEFAMRNPGDLTQVLQVMRRLGEIVRSWEV
ncbi:restriction endonuclease subunit R [Alkalinema sp. FACHB-956]|uniref:restriction endonuclease subunit R n=1 Tax=Alkalinema sp. FACHB-956 TaxID=2692768 RepID=UPI001688073F|nr:restriction endonuclease subunit R [Alkalinema sp. FACHB-956]MBD2329569.1 restriction endonuclease subunit R [Alkalinema sp. FACHB-956]